MGREPQAFKARLWRGKPVRRMHVMVKPTGPLCNLHCTYCYYLSKQVLLTTENRWRITDEILEAFIRQYFQGQNYQEVVFSWQGGEPTLLGLDFFRRVVELQQRYCPPRVRCENDLQTNGTLLNEAWCEFLAEHNFLVGVSLDGPKELHDHYRKDKAGAGSFDRVFRAARLLRKHQVNFATLSCVNRLTAQQPLQVYRFLRDEVGAKRLQFIPIVEPVGFWYRAPQYRDSQSLPVAGSPQGRPGHPESIVEDWCVDPDDWGEFLCRIFDEWYRKDLGQIYVHYFEAAVETWMGHVSPLCTQAPMCGKGLALEHDGSVYACDHYVYPEYRLGNILEQPLEDLAYSDGQERFGRGKEGTLPEYCRRCEYEFACFGECPKNRILKTPEGEPGLEAILFPYRSLHPENRPQPGRSGGEGGPQPHSFELAAGEAAMKWEMASLEDGYRQMRIETPWDEIAPDYEDILHDLMGRRVPGFRPGKAPRQVMEQRFRRQISGQLTRRGADRLCRQALQESGTEAAGPVEVSGLEWEPGQPFRFTARFFPLPEFELPDYQSLALNSAAAEDPQGALSLRLLELVSFPVPQALVQAELALDGLADCPPTSESWQAASQRVRLMLILKRIARAEGIEIEPADVDRRIEEKAAEFGARPETMRAELEESGGRLRLQDLLLAESVLEYLLETIR